MHEANNLKRGLSSSVLFKKELFICEMNYCV